MATDKREAAQLPVVRWSSSQFATARETPANTPVIAAQVIRVRWLFGLLWCWGRFIECSMGLRRNALSAPAIRSGSGHGAGA